jgi:hypothetical protein
MLGAGAGRREVLPCAYGCQFRSIQRTSGGGSSIMALNDTGYGGDGSPIINWPAGEKATSSSPPSCPPEAAG